MTWRTGVDIGGTFTDLAAIDEASDRIGVVKLLTSADDFSRAVVDGLRRIIEREGIEPREVALLGACDYGRHQRTVREESRPYRPRYDARFS